MHRVEFENVSKRYRLGRSSTAREAFAAAGSRLARRPQSPARDQAKELWSLREVSFAVGDGEALGIVGRNGAGKSTILKILAAITAPTSGVSRTRGRVAALLEVGTGFHPELTGRENVYLNGAILGMSRADIRRRFDEIVDFSGVERFLDTPIKRYSSGMYLRLAFAVAAHLDPDVLVVDEILAVGDAEFQRKCLRRMQEAEEEGRTLLFVSHDLEALSRICRRSLWLDSGRVRASAATDTVIRDYLAAGAAIEQPTGAAIAAGPVTVRAVQVLPAEKDHAGILLRTDRLRIEVDLELSEEIPGLDLAVWITTSSGVRVLDEVLSDRLQLRFPGGRHRAALAVPPVLNVGNFTVGLWVGTAHEEFIAEPVVTSFTLHGSDLGRPQRTVVLELPFVVERLGP